MHYKFAAIKKLICLCLLVVFAAILCSGCSNTSNSNVVDTPQGNNAASDSEKITVGAYFTQDKNPLATKTSYNEQMYFLMYDGLYHLNSKYEAVENLACGYQIQDSGYTVQIAVKPNVFFHDGSELTAHDVKATIQYLLDNGGYYNYNIRNIKEVSVIDNHTIRLKLSDLTPNLKLQLTFPIVCKKNLLDATKFQYNGTGPYCLSSETRGKHLLLKQNENYHRKFSSDIKEIEVSLIPDAKTARSLSASGILDMFYSSFYEEGLKTVTKYESQKFDYLSDEYTFLTLNYDVKMLNEKTFRQALYYAIDRDNIRDSIFMTHATSAYLPLPPESWAYNDNKENMRNIEYAKQVLSDLGFSDKDNNGILEFHDEDEEKELVLDLLSTDDIIKKEICESLISNLKEVGISLKVQYVTPEEFPQKIEEKIHDLYLITTNLGYDLDLAPFFNGTFASPVSIDYGSYLKKFAVSDELAVKQPEYMRLCDEFYEYVPHVPIVFLKQTMLLSNKLNTITEVNPSYFYYGILNQ